MNGKKLVVYLVVPLALGLGLLGMYFSGNLVLQRIVSPKLPPLPLDSWREMGLLEGVEHLVIFLIIIAFLAGIVRKQAKWERVAFAALAAGSIFFFLEEIDYGTHYYDYWTSDTDFRWFAPLSELQGELAKIPPAEAPFNLHNRDLPVIGDLTNLFKGIATLVLFGWFFVLPLIAPRLKNPWLRYLAPDRYILCTLAVMMIISVMAHELGDYSDDAFKQALIRGETPKTELGSIQSNLSEFRELNIYYIVLAYLADIIFIRRSPAGH